MSIGQELGRILFCPHRHSAESYFAGYVCWSIEFGRTFRSVWWCICRNVDISLRKAVLLSTCDVSGDASTCLATQQELVHFCHFDLCDCFLCVCIFWWMECGGSRTFCVCVLENHSRWWATMVNGPCDLAYHKWVLSTPVPLLMPAANVSWCSHTLCVLRQRQHWFASASHVLVWVVAAPMW